MMQSNTLVLNASTRSSGPDAQRDPNRGTGAIIESHTYHIKAQRDLFYEDSLKEEIVVDLGKTNRIKEARGKVKQEINSHLDMLDHHEYFDLTFDVVYNEKGTRAVIQGYDDVGYLRYNYFVWVEDNEMS